MSQQLYVVTTSGLRGREVLAIFDCHTKAVDYVHDLPDANWEEIRVFYLNNALPPAPIPQWAPMA